MKFDKPAGPNPIDQGKVIGKPTDRIDGRFKTTGTAKYAYERHDVAPHQAYGHVVVSAIAKGRIRSLNLAEARAAPGVVDIVTWQNAGAYGTLPTNPARLLAGPDIQHYHQAIALVVAESFEQARHAASLVRVDYDRADGEFDLAAQAKAAEAGKANAVPPTISKFGDFETSFAQAPVKLDARYTTPDQSHFMMEPHTSVAAWEGDTLHLWTSNQMIGWAADDLSQIFRIPRANIHVSSPYIGGGFGAKLRIKSDAMLAALAARVTGRAVKVALARPQVPNNTVHRPATAQRIQLAAGVDGRLLAISHEGASGNLAGGRPENATSQTRLLYAAPHRQTIMRQTLLDLPEGNSMRAPGEAPGLMALEIAMDEMAEKLGLDPVEFRILNDTQVDPQDPSRPFSQRHLVECLKTGAERFGWARRNAKPAQTRDGPWLIGMGVAAGYRGNMITKSAARVRLETDGSLTVETDMTDIGTGSYTILAQTAAEMLGVPLSRVTVKLGDSTFPTSSGSGGQWGANNSTAGLFAACSKLREIVAQKLGLDPALADFADEKVRVGKRSLRLVDAARDGAIVAEDAIEYGDVANKVRVATFAAHFVEAAVHAFTGEVRIRRMLAVCDCGRILNPKAARSQVIGAMTMGVGGALMEDLGVDQRFGYFVHHDFAQYAVPVHADIPHQDVIFLDYPDDKSSPMKAKGVAELGLCGVGAAVANAVYNATGVRLRDYPMTLDKHLEKLPMIV